MVDDCTIHSRGNKACVKNQPALKRLEFDAYLLQEKELQSQVLIKKIRCVFLGV